MVCGSVVDGKVTMGCGGKTYPSHQPDSWQHGWFAYCKDCRKAINHLIRNSWVDCVCGDNIKPGLVGDEMRCENCDIGGVNYVDCADCEGPCRADETESCENCGIELRIGCAENPSDHSIFDDRCDDCRVDDDCDSQNTGWRKCDKSSKDACGECKYLFAMKSFQP